MNIEVIDENIIDIQFQEAALRLAKRKTKWNANRQLLVGVVNALVKCGVEPSFDTEYLAVNCTGDKDTLTKIIRVFRTSGFNSDAAKPKQGDSTWNAWFRSSSCTVQIFFMFSSSVCKRVAIGKHMVEEVIYETQCGDISSSEEAPMLTVDAAQLEQRVSDDLPY